MIELQQFKRAFGVMNASPFCMKVEVFLKLSGLPYQVNDTLPPFKTPKGKFPAIRDQGNGGVVVGDSEFILAYLQRQYRDRLPPNLREPERGADLAVRRLLEEDLYFAMLWGRWIDDAAFAQVGPAFFGFLPWPVSRLVAALVRRKMRRDLVGQGTGRHSPAEIAARAMSDTSALSAVLGARPFFGGDQPSALDCSAYAFIANGLWVPIDTPVQRHLKTLAPLVAYAQRMEALVGR